MLTTHTIEAFSFSNAAKTILHSQPFGYERKLFQAEITAFTLRYDPKYDHYYCSPPRSERSCLQSAACSAMKASVSSVSGDTKPPFCKRASPENRVAAPL